MRHHRHGSAVVTYPSELEVTTTRMFDAPIALVYEVLTTPEHVRHWFAPFEDRVTVCEIDLRVGGEYRVVFVTPDGRECSFSGRYVELEAPTRIVQTWLFEGWPDAEALETDVLSEADGVTTLTVTMAFADLAGRAHMSRHDGQESSFDKLEDYLASLCEGEVTR